MRKIHFLMGVILLSTILVSCANDDNFKQEVENNIMMAKKENFEIHQASKINSQSNHAEFYRGGDDEDKDKYTGKK